jgi:Spy/CpxP family protein refolding chaperone
MRIWVMALVGILVWVASSTQHASAESGTRSENAPVMKQAQESQGNDMITKRAEIITRRLGLTTEQQAAIKPILVEEAAKLKELRADVKLTVAELRTKLLELRAATDTKIRSILTPEQQQKHDALLKEASERRKIMENK